MKTSDRTFSVSAADLHRRIEKLRGVLRYCEAARLPHRAEHVEQLIADCSARMERLQAEQSLDPEDRKTAELRRRCLRCVHHRFWGTCRTDMQPLRLFGAVFMVERRCAMETGQECPRFSPRRNGSGLPDTDDRQQQQQ